MRWRVRSQLVIPPLLLMLAVCGLSVWLAQASVDRARQRLETRVRDVARNLSETSYPLAENVLVQMKRLSGADFLLIPLHGNPVSTLSQPPDALPQVEVVTDWQQLRLGPPIHSDGRDFLCGGVRLVRPPRSGEVLYILYPENQWRDAWWEAVTPVLAVGAAVGGMAVLLALALGRSLSRRLGDLERRTRLIASGDFSPMPLPHRDDELRDLAHSVNDMANRLAQYEQAVRRTERLRLLGQVSGGLAHQLRNGLTGARLAVQVYLHENAGNAPDGAALEVAIRQLTLLETNLKRFLDLGRADPGRRDPLDLVGLVDDAVDLMRPRARHATIDLTWRKPEQSFAISGDSGQLGQLVLNVLANALDAAGPGGQVEVRLLEQAMFLLEVEDSGPGPSDQVADRLFEPFVTGKPEGVGLGLAMARQAAEAHGGSIAWERRADHTIFRVTIPRAEGKTTGPPALANG